MMLTELIAYFRREGAFEEFCKAHTLNAESEVIEIYAQVPAQLDSKLGFFPIEETDGQAEFSSAGITFQTLFDFFYFLKVIEDLKGKDAPSDEELAEQLFSYTINDA